MVVHAFVPALQRQRPGNYEFEISLLYTTSSRIAKTMYLDPVSTKQKTKPSRTAEQINKSLSTLKKILNVK